MQDEDLKSKKEELEKNLMRKIAEIPLNLLT